jgi:hypothetical protein
MSQHQAVALPESSYTRKIENRVQGPEASFYIFGHQGAASGSAGDTAKGFCCFCPSKAGRQQACNVVR